VFEFTGQFGGPASLYPIPKEVKLPNKISQYLSYTFRSYIPLSFNRGRYYRLIQPQVDYQYTNTYYNADTSVYQGIDYLHYRLFLYRYLHMCSRDIYPKWGQSITITYTQTPKDKKLLGSIFSVSGYFYFPGLLPHHSLFIYGGFQVQQLKAYYLSLNRINFPRGYSESVSAKFSALNLNYTFPVVCPDWSVAPLIYLKRIRANLFYDFSYGKDIIEHTDAGTVRYTGDYQSIGTEIFADFYLIRFIFPISAGVRIGILPKDNKHFMQFIATVNIN
jgi:hypothetical protein